MQDEMAEAVAEREGFDPELFFTQWHRQFAKYAREF